MRHSFLFILFWFSWISTIAGVNQAKVDSLNRVYDESYQTADYLSANEVLNELREMYYQSGDSNNVVACIIRQADIYRATKQYGIAHHELVVLLESSFQLNTRQLVEIYSLQGAISYEELDYSSMLVYTEQAIELARQYNVEDNLPGLYNLLGRYYADVDPDLCLRYLNYSIEGYLEQGRVIGSILPQIHLARLKLAQKEYDEALQTLDRVSLVLDTHFVMVYNQMTVDLYTRIYVAKEEYKQALHYSRKSDSLHRLIVDKLARATDFHKKQLTSSAWSDLQAENMRLKASLNNKDTSPSPHVFWSIAVVALMLLVVWVWFSKQKQVSEVSDEILLLNQKLDQRSKELASKRHHTITKANSLQELNEFKSKVLSILGHDLRGPIAQLITYQQAKEGGVEFSPEELAQMDRVILAGAQNSLLVLDNLLKWASGGENGTEEPEVDVNLSFMINHIINQIKITAQQKNVIINLGDLDKEVTTKESLIKLVIRNLISNAVKFSSEGDRITVNVASKEGKLKISIADTGNGIPADVLHAIRNAGEKIKPTTGSMGERGIGLGLQLSVQFANQINGHLTFENNSPKGTIASLILPAH